MFRRYTDLKYHYGKETMMEVLEDQALQKELSNCKIYLNGKPIVIWRDQKEGRLKVVVNNRFGAAVIRDLTEEYLEKLMIHAGDYATITSTEFDDGSQFIDFDEIRKAAYSEYKKEELDAIGAARAGANVILGMALFAVCKIGFGSSNVANPTQASTRSRKR